MEEENKIQEKKQEVKEIKNEIKKVAEAKPSDKPSEVKIEKEEVKETRKKVKGNAIVNARDVGISTKHAIALCNFIRGKEPHYAIELLEKVLIKKIAVPMRGEIPHRKNMPKGKVSGRYPVKASRAFIKMIKSLIANANVKNLDVENLRIVLAKANKASRPYKPTRIAYGRKRFKRTHVTLEAKTIGMEKKGEKKR